jgi:hypothetical protein
MYECKIEPPGSNIPAFKFQAEEREVYFFVMKEKQFRIKNLSYTERMGCWYTLRHWAQIEPDFGRPKGRFPLVFRGQQ